MVLAAPGGYIDGAPYLCSKTTRWDPQKAMPTSLTLRRAGSPCIQSQCHPEIDRERMRSATKGYNRRVCAEVGIESFASFAGEFCQAAVRGRWFATAEENWHSEDVRSTMLHTPSSDRPLGYDGPALQQLNQGAVHRVTQQCCSLTGCCSMGHDSGADQSQHIEILF
jgi:hypothetical protein